MKKPTLFICPEGALIEELGEAQVNDLRHVRFTSGVFSTLLELIRRGFALVLLNLKEGAAEDFVLKLLHSQGIGFAGFIPHAEGLGQYVQDHAIDLERSALIGHRAGDLEPATKLNLRVFTVARDGAPDHNWAYVLEALTARRATLVRQTRETQIDVRVNLDREEIPKVATGIGFFDHMLAQLAKHGGFSLELRTLGDLHIDEHHTVEDSALALGSCLRQALGDKRGLARYGFLLPMDESEARVSLDLSGRPHSTFSGRFEREQVGQFPTELVQHFFRSFSDGLAATLHVTVSGENTHHMIEACFKSVGRTLRQAFRVDGHVLPSTKGIL